MTSHTPSADPIDGLEELAKRSITEATSATQVAGPLQVVAFFDLSGSSQAKLTRGNAPASRDALAFTSLASSIAAQFSGQVVKSLGDGVLATFLQPLDGCRAALNLRHATYEYLDHEMTGGLTAGSPLKISLDGDQFDILGDVVDRAARIQSLAAPGQVLIDEVLRGQVRADLAARQGILIDETSRQAYAKGIGELNLYEISLGKHWHLKKHLATPYTLIVTGRPTLSEKLALIGNAEREIIEIGIGLTSFAQYFTGQKPDEFRDPIRVLVRGGVDLRCFALDPTYKPGLDWLDEQGNPDYIDEASIAKKRLVAEAKHYRNENYRGRLVYHTYRRIPEFWCLGVDVDDPINGRMFFAPYLMGIARSAMPVIQVSRTSNGELYEKYLSCVDAVREASNVS